MSLGTLAGVCEKAGEGTPTLQCGRGACLVSVSACDASGDPATCPRTDATLAESCDGIDNDCNGVVDEGCPCVEEATQLCFRGSPKEQSVGICQNGLQQCANGAWGTCIGDILPTSETCDGFDNDCNGKVDEGCACTDGATQTCYDGPEATQNKGPCHDGRQTCSNGAWGECLSEMLPQPETCDGFDNDCDGIVDNGCACIVGTTQACYTGPQNTQGRGECHAGTELCVKGQWGACTGEVVPATAEICNGLDDDCNGLVDDAAPGKTLDDGGVCSVDDALGPCIAGIKRCRDGEQECIATYVAQTEICDNVDNDCNGKVDDGFIPGTGMPCKVNGQLGQCASGITACLSAQIQCTQTYLPEPEACNGLDDNCDGAVDEANPGGGVNKPCLTGELGECALGTYNCKNAVLECDPTTPATAEVCDGKDNDCDGVNDNAPASGILPGVGVACATGKSGECSAGTTICISNGTLTCAQTSFPRAEVCDGRDNDCNGSTDDGGVCGPTCASPLIACGSVCVDPRYDVDNCGGCGKACEPVHGTSYCSLGECLIVGCASGFASCDGNAYNGCETYLQADAAHCGACNIACSAPQTCQGGTCK